MYGMEFDGIDCGFACVFFFLVFVVNENMNMFIFFLDLTLFITF